MAGGPADLQPVSATNAAASDATSSAEVGSAALDAADLALGAAGVGVVVSSLTQAGRIRWQQPDRAAQSRGAIRW